MTSYATKPSPKDNAGPVIENFFLRNAKRIGNILAWIATGNFSKLGRAIIDQVLIRSVPFRRFIRKHPAFQKKRQKLLLKRLLARYYGVGSPDNQAKFRVALIMRDGTTYPKSSAFIRLISPLTHPAMHDKVSIKLYDENTTSVDGETNVCIVQRTAYDNQETAGKLIDNLRINNVALVVDSDDAFHEIDESHPEHSMHTESIDAINRIARVADQIWLSVPALVPSYPSSKNNISVVKNCLDDRVWKKMITKKRGVSQAQASPIRMIYMGTATHDTDLRMILSALDEVAAACPRSFTLTVIGVSEDLPDRPWANRIYQPRHGSLYPNFVRWFQSQGPFDIGLSPLVDSEFNRGKSDIKCLDYLAARIVPIVSDTIPYQVPELEGFIVKVTNSHQAWVSELTKIVKNPAAFRLRSAKILSGAQKYIWTQRSSKSAAKQILGLLEQLR